jgi:hypothetical protein
LLGAGGWMGIDITDENPSLFLSYLLKIITLCLLAALYSLSESLAFYVSPHLDKFLI